MDVIQEVPPTATQNSPLRAGVLSRPVGWILACALAEGIGMSAAASAARAAEGLPAYTALALVVAGGLVEGIALGVLQAAWLSRRFPGLSRAGWITTTVMIAGLGWALASAPSALADPGGSAPPPALILLMAAALGLAMGAVLGGAQVLVLCNHVRHPWQWIWISALAWAPAMVVIFAGATLPDATWPTPAVVALGAATGLVAGTLLGLVSIALMGMLTGRAIPASGRRSMPS